MHPLQYPSQMIMCRHVFPPILCHFRCTWCWRWPPILLHQVIGFGDPERWDVPNLAGNDPARYSRVLSAPN